MLDKAAVKRMCEEVPKELKAWAEANGFTVERGAASFDDMNFSLTIKFTTADTAALEKKEKDIFLRNCAYVGLEPKHFGAKFSVQGKRYQVVGFATGGRKFPIKAKDLSTGKITCFTSLAAAHIKEQVG